jgi:benzodiazapine receptor
MPDRPDAGWTPGEAALLAAGAVALGGLLGAPFNPNPARPGISAWYRSLAKPPGTPPRPVIAITWPVLQTLLAIAGYRLLRAPRGRDRGAALGWWGFSVAMIPIWSAIFFGAGRMGAGTAAASAELAGGVALVAAARRVDGVAAAASVPLVAWLAFANWLAAGLWRRNPGRSGSAA